VVRALRLRGNCSEPSFSREGVANKAATCAAGDYKMKMTLQMRKLSRVSFHALLPVCPSLGSDRNFPQGDATGLIRPRKPDSLRLADYSPIGYECRWRSFANNPILGYGVGSYSVNGGQRSQRARSRCRN
jgi:hypothetical protein